MEIIESWEDNRDGVYAVVRHSDSERKEYRTREYEVMYFLDGELNSFGGSVGYNSADFDTIEQAKQFLLTGIAGQDDNPDIWLDMVEA